MAARFSSPYGDKLKSVKVSINDNGKMFPSPCGDKLKSQPVAPADVPLDWFSSPCGDKLKCSLISIVDFLSRGFRPLAGIS